MRAEGEPRFVLLAATALGLTWSVSAGALGLGECVRQPLLRCGSSNYNAVDAWATATLLAGCAVAYAVTSGARFAPYLTLAYATYVGIVARAFRTLQLYVSDVIDATREALGIVAHGGNPYLHDFLTTNPPHSPFPYLPGELLLYGLPYALTGSIDTVDRTIGMLTVLLFAALAPIAGVARTALVVAVYATFELAAATSVDGTNDGGAAFVLVLGGVVLAYARAARERGWPSRTARAFEIAGALVFGWALAYKATVWPFFPFVALHLWRENRRLGVRFASIAVATALVAIVPFLFPDPHGFFGNVYRGFVFNQYFYGGTFWSTLIGFGASLDPASKLVSITYSVMVLGTFAALVRLPSRSLGGAYARGAAVIGTALFFAHFATSSYYAFVGAAFLAAIALGAGSGNAERRDAPPRDCPAPLADPAMSA